jgi:hypothetical protein
MLSARPGLFKWAAKLIEMQRTLCCRYANFRPGN